MTFQENDKKNNGLDSEYKVSVKVPVGPKGGLRCVTSIKRCCVMHWLAYFDGVAVAVAVVVIVVVVVVVVVAVVAVRCCCC